MRGPAIGTPTKQLWDRLLCGGEFRGYVVEKRASKAYVACNRTRHGLFVQPVPKAGMEGTTQNQY